METKDLDRSKEAAIYPVPCNDIADDLGNTRMANMVALGAFAAATGVLPIKAIQDGLEGVISAHYKEMIPKNAKALEAGAAHVEKHGSL